MYCKNQDLHRLFQSCFKQKIIWKNTYHKKKKKETRQSVRHIKNSDKALGDMPPGMSYTANEMNLL